jgi:hypothetical protein
VEITMNGEYQKRRRFSPGAELLEGRQLLNAHLPAAPHATALHAAVHVAAASTHAPRQITGTLTGLAPYTATSADGLAGTDSYTASGKTSFGSGSITGVDSFTSTLKNAKTYNDIYYGGDLTLTLGNGSTVAISYVGSGRSPTVNGPYSLTVHGEAVGTSGSLRGHFYSFTATEVGNEIDSSVRIKFTLKD